MSDLLQAVAAQASDFGPLAAVVTYGLYAVAAAGAVYVLARSGRWEFEPADTEVPRLAERAGVVFGAVVMVIAFAQWNEPAHSTELKALSGVAAVGLVVAFFRFLRLSQHYLHEAPHLAVGTEHKTQRIVGDEDRLTEQAAAQRKNDVSLRDLIWGCGQDFDRVFNRKRRNDLKVQYQVAYFLLIVGFIVAVASAGLLLSVVSTATPATSPTTAPAAAPTTPAPAAQLVRTDTRPVAPMATQPATAPTSARVPATVPATAPDAVAARPAPSGEGEHALLAAASDLFAGTGYSAPHNPLRPMPVQRENPERLTPGVLR